jgi:hypothetical protein
VTEDEEGEPVQSQWTRADGKDLCGDVVALGRAVDEGALWIDGVLVAAGAHERCARRYDLLADQVERQIRVLSAAVSLPGFGGFESGNALRRGFENKVITAIVRLSEYSSAARELARIFRAAAVAYTERDAALAASLGTAAPDVMGAGGHV